MNNKFDELTKGLAQSVTRRQALQRFSVDLAGVLLASFGMAGKAQAAKPCATAADCQNGQICVNGRCSKACGQGCDCKKRDFGCCPGNGLCFDSCACVCGSPLCYG